MSVKGRNESPVAPEQAIEIGDRPPILISRYGSRSLIWDVRTLAEVVARLQHEREQKTSDNASDTARLLHTAELIKLAATQHIITTDAPE
jgi:hypothetical protein